MNRTVAFLAFLGAVLLAPATAMTSVTPILTTPAQVAAEFRRDVSAARSRYLGREVQVTGTADDIVHSSFPGYSGVHFYATPPFPEVSVQCHFDDPDLAILQRVSRGSAVVLSGSATEQVEPRTIRLQHCRVVSQKAVQASPRIVALPADPPLGEYTVYQWSGAGGLTYQTRFTLLSSTAYRLLDGLPGTYTYDHASKRLRFTSGPLRGFGGLYYTVGRNANGPTIALNPTGPVTDLETQAYGAYQFAFFRPGSKP